MASSSPRCTAWATGLKPRTRYSPPDHWRCTSCRFAPEYGRGAMAANHSFLVPASGSRTQQPLHGQLLALHPRSSCVDHTALSPNAFVCSTAGCWRSLDDIARPGRLGRRPKGRNAPCGASGRYAGRPVPKLLWHAPPVAPAASAQQSQRPAPVAAGLGGVDSRGLAAR